jgi:PEP-CTERM motif
LTDPIPEPASFSMLALGIGLLGAAVYARSVTRFNV